MTLPEVEREQREKKLFNDVNNIEISTGKLASRDNLWAYVLVLLVCSLVKILSDVRDDLHVIVRGLNYQAIQDVLKERSE